MGIQPPLKYTEEKAIRDGLNVLVPGGKMKTVFSDADTKDLCSARTTQLLRENKARFYVLGTLWYNDGFGTHHHTDYCSYLTPGKKGAIPCTFHNEAD